MSNLKVFKNFINYYDKNGKPLCIGDKYINDSIPDQINTVIKNTEDSAFRFFKEKYLALKHIEKIDE